MSRLFAARRRRRDLRGALARSGRGDDGAGQGRRQAGRSRWCGDAAVEADVQRIVEAGVKAFGKLDTLVNNAGDGGPTKPVQDYTDRGLVLHDQLVPRRARTCARGSWCPR